MATPKACRVCGVTKPLNQFGPHGRTKDGISNRCKSCVAEAAEVSRQKQRKYNAEWRANNPDYYTEWRQQNRGYASYQTALHKQETPDCITKEQKEEILAIYTKAAQWSDTTDTDYHVDHIVPRIGLDEDGNHIVSGLHVPQNLRIMPAELNNRKGKRLLEELS